LELASSLCVLLSDPARLDLPPIPNPPRRGSRLSLIRSPVQPRASFLSKRAALTRTPSEAVEGKNGWSRADPPPWLSPPYCWSAAAQVLASAFHVPPAASQSALFLALAASPAKAGPVTATAIAKASIEMKLFRFPPLLCLLGNCRPRRTLAAGTWFQTSNGNFYWSSSGRRIQRQMSRQTQRKRAPVPITAGMPMVRIACSMPSKPKAGPSVPFGARRDRGNRVHGRGVGVRSASARPSLLRTLPRRCPSGSFHERMPRA